MAAKILGINDEVTTCECCGRTNLKKTVVLGTEHGEVRYGTACAAKALRQSERSVKAAATVAEQNRTRPVKYWFVRNETLSCWVGGMCPIRFATQEEATARFAGKDWAGSAHPVYA